MTLTDPANTPCYIARTTAPTKHNPIVGTVVFATVEDGTRTRDVAREVAKCIRDGLTVERVPVWWVRLHFGTTEVYREGDQAPDEARAA